MPNSSARMAGSPDSKIATELVSGGQPTRRKNNHQKRKWQSRNFINRSVNCNFLMKVIDPRRRGLDYTKLLTWTRPPYPTSGPTYDTTNSPTVWVRGGVSGMDKRQCTVQLTIFADGQPRVKPLLIFRGKGK